MPDEEMEGQEEPEKRMAGNYEITQAVRIGGKEVVLGVDESSPEPYFCAFYTANELFYQYTDCMVGDNYVKEHLSAKRIDLGVFENNESARYCYEAVGFTDYAKRECEMPIGTWKCTDMEMFIEKSLETERLILRRWEESDGEDLYKYASNPDVGPIAGWAVHTSVENSREIIKGVLSEPETYAVVLKETGHPVGSIGLMLGKASNIGIPDTEGEIGYWIGVPYWGQGLIPEAVREIMRYGFEELNLEKLWCGYFDGNEKSKRVQEKCGFHYHHTSENVPCALEGVLRTEHITCLTKEEWLEKR